MILRIGHLSTFYHTSVLLMACKEFLASSSLQISWRLYGTGPSIVEAFAKDEIDMAYIGIPPAVIGINRGLKLKCIAGGHVEGTVVAAHSQAMDFTLTGSVAEVLRQFKTVGVPAKGSIHDLILRDFIDRYSLPVEVKNYRWADEILEAFVKGDVEGVCGTPALAQAVREFAEAKVVCPPEVLWPNNPSYGIVVKEELLGHTEILEEFLLIHENACEFLRKAPAQAASRIAEFIKIVNSDFVYNTLTLSSKYCASLSEEYIACSMKMVERLKELGYINRILQREDIFYPDIIDRVHRGPHHYS